MKNSEITELTTKSDLHGSWAVLSTWAVIGGTFAAVASTWEYLPVWGKLLMCIAALVILAGRQLALAIIMHDASHQSLFKTKWLNDIATDWLCARPIWNDLKKLLPVTLKHNGVKVAPRTFLNLVYTADGNNLDDILKDLDNDVIKNFMDEEDKLIEYITTYYNEINNEVENYIPSNEVSSSIKMQINGAILSIYYELDFNLDKNIYSNNMDMRKRYSSLVVS